MYREEERISLRDRASIYPVNEILRRINGVAMRFFERAVGILKREKAEELDICRRKYRAKYHVQKNNICLDERAKNIIEMHEGELLYKNDYGIITYLLTYFWRNYPMLKCIMSEYVDEFPFLNRRNIKMLDIGTGVGTIPLALSHFLDDLSEIRGSRFNIKYYLCDESERMLREILPAFCHDLDIKVIPVNSENPLDGLQNLLEKFRSKFDLITISYLLSELGKEDGERILKKLIQFMDEDGRLILIEPSHFARNLRERVNNVSIESGIEAIFKRVGEGEGYDFRMDMRNKEEANRVVLGNFDISRSFFCFSIIGRMDRGDLEPIFTKEKPMKGYWRIISCYILSTSRVGEKYQALGVVSYGYVGLIYVKNEILPLGDRKLIGRTIKVVITKNKTYRNHEAFYIIEISEESMSSEEISWCLESTREDIYSGVIRGTIEEINRERISINSRRFGRFTAKWNDSLIPSLSYQEYGGGRRNNSFSWLFQGVR